MGRRGSLLLSGGLRACWVIAAGALPAIAVQACSGCSSADDSGAVPGPDAADAAAEVRPDTGIDADAAEVFDAVHEDSAAILPDAYPDAVPPGWEAWTGWSPECPMYVPGPDAAMPPPIEWEPCPPPVSQDIACQRMKDTWSTSESGITYDPNFAIDAISGTPVLQFTRYRVDDDPALTYRMVAEVDGPVRVALFNPESNTGRCGNMQQSLDSLRYAFNPHTLTGPSGGNEYGVIAGKLSDRVPTIVFRPPDVTEPSNWYHGEQWFVRLVLGKHTAWSWDLTTSHTVYRAGDDPENLPPHDAMVVGGDVLTTVAVTSRCGVMSWNLQHGSRPLLRYFGDSTKGAGNFGTDGKDMVWTYAEGSPTIKACDHEAPMKEVWTAPYTTDPAELQATARRVRKDVRGMNAFPYVVGQGYAMRVGSFVNPPGHSVFLVRLSDGYSWFILGSPGTDPLAFDRALGFTQEEVFVAAVMRSEGKGGMTILRIRLDSLGPGTPPD